MDFSVLADRDCLVAFAAVVLCSDRGVAAHKMGYDYGGIAHLTAKGAAGQTGLSRAASGRALRRLEEAGLIISNGDGDSWRTSAGIFAEGGDASPEPGQDIASETADAETEIVGARPSKPLPPPIAALMEQFGMTEADVLALAMSSPAEDFSIPDEVYVGGRRVPRRELPRLKKSAATTVHTVKASLHGAKPPVWRRLELPSELTLDMVHEVMQIAFAWHGYHLHQFETACGTFGRPDDDGDWGFEELGDESSGALVQVAAEEKAKIVYVYDFGDDWRHDIVVEKITPALPGVAYPRCTGGRGWAPEEDSGGIWAHNEAVAAAGPVMPFTPAALGALSSGGRDSPESGVRHLGRTVGQGLIASMRSGRRPFRPGTRAGHRKGQRYRQAQGRSATLRVDVCAGQRRCRGFRCLCPCREDLHDLRGNERDPADDHRARGHRAGRAVALTCGPTVRELCGTAPRRPATQPPTRPQPKRPRTR